MPTLLVNAKMNPALAQRVEKAVTGSGGQKLIVRRIIAIARIALVLGVIFVIYSYVRGKKQAKDELEKARTDLLTQIANEGASVTPSQRTIVTRSEAWMKQLGAPYERDLIDPSLRWDPLESTCRHASLSIL